MRSSWLQRLPQRCAAGQPPFYLRLRAGAASALQESLFAHGASFTTAADEEEAGGSGEDERASLVLQLLLGTLDAPAPNLAHMLLGFDCEQGPEGVAATQLDPRLAYSCLSAALRGAQSASLPAAKPAAYEALLELLCQLAAAPLTQEATLQLLRSLRLVACQLDPVMAGILPQAVSMACGIACCLHQGKASSLQ